MKTCTKCGETKLVSEYHKRAHSSDGRQSHCKSCHNTTIAKWRAENPEKQSAAEARQYAANRDDEKARAAKYRAANPEKQKARDTAYRAANPEAVRIHNHNRRARKRANGGKLSRDIAERLFKLQRGKCACGCGKSLGDDYHLDHILPIKLGGANTDDNIQLLRKQCNLRKSAKHPVDFMQQRGFLL